MAGIEVVGFALTLLATAEQCLRIGRDLKARYNAFSNAHQELAESALRVEHFWFRAEAEIEVLCDANTVTALKDKVIIHLNRMLEVLCRKLFTAISQLEATVDDDGKVKKMKYAVYRKESLLEAINDLEKWSGYFEPSWFALARASGKAIDEKLGDEKAEKGEHQVISTMRSLRDAVQTSSNPRGSRQSIFSPQRLLVNRQSIANSNEEIGYDERHGQVIVDTVRCESNSEQNALKVVRDLAVALSKVEPSVFGILSCQGVLRCPTEPPRFPTWPQVMKFELLLGVPVGFQNPQSLRSLLLNTSTAPLEARFHLAKGIARSVLFMHTFNFVHKNIRPETILVFQSAAKTWAPFLVGFEQFRLADGNTYKRGDIDWAKNLYRHPRRQGLSFQDEYMMQHDVYSLGVVLLEIGMWTSFVTLLGPERWPNPVLKIDDFLKMKQDTQRAVGIKKTLVKIAETELPSRMGSKYTRVVVDCLKCLDKGNETFGDKAEFLDDDGLLVAVVYIEKILGALAEFVV